MNEYIEMKIGKMRKPQSFLVQKVSVIGENRTDIVVQSEKSIGQLNTKTGEFIFNPKGQYFPHLAFAKPTELPKQLRGYIQ